MATVTLLPAMNGGGERSIHPFFKRTTNGCHEESQDSSDFVNGAADPLDLVQLDGVQDEKPKAKRSRKPKVQREEEGTGKKQKTLQDIVNPKAQLQPAPGTNVENAISPVSSGPILDVPRRKRRRTGQYEAREMDDGPEIANSTSDAAILLGEPAEITMLRRPSSPRVVIPASSPLPPRAPALEDAVLDTNAGAPSTPPRKVLRLNANGKFSSPMIKKSKQVSEQEAEVPKRRGRPRKSKEAGQLMVTICYSSDATRRAEIGLKINRILSGEERVATLADRKTTPKKPCTPRKPAKCTHPFFLGKPKEEPQAQKHESPRKTTATTPGKLRMQVLGDRLPEARKVPYAVGSGLLKDRLVVRHPGAKDPPWPDKEQAHVRGLDHDELLDASAALNQSTSRKRKRKAARLPFPADQSVLYHFATHLRPDEDSRLRQDGFHEPPAALRVPMRLLITGHDLRRRVAPELSVELHDDGDDILAMPTSSQLSAHPALHNLWEGIPRTLTAFDELRGENVGWTQKYAPETASEVLQPAHELKVLREWLTSLTVTAVERTSVAHVKAPAKVDVKPRKKRWRKNDDMDDFLVDSDEEIQNMDEVTDPEDLAPAAGTKLQKSVVQKAIEGAKLSNAVLLSGRSGCGKTAAAYAIAKELGFKVFDISSSERRSGKDVLDKVGDLTENHIVKHHGADVGELSSAEEPNKARLDEAFKRDLASGRQGKMNAFYKPKAGVKPAPPKAKAPSKAKVLEAVEQAIKKPPKDQQQSLILLEEVDILFKDDKDFWNTVLKLIVSSKRPFILTCNDEDLVPLQAMNLHAILRFTQPPADLATDYLLLLAAAEGHLLKRDAMASLYQAKGRDLRATIAELDLWCQMAVGDVKGGLGWICQRYPPGSVVDERGRKLRVVSDGTYQEGMGALPEDLGEEERMMWAWREFGVEPMDSLNHSVSYLHSNDPLTALKRHTARAEALSAVDAFAGRRLPDTAPLDTTLPEMADKARNQYTEGLRLVQADERVDHSELGVQLVVASVCALSRTSAQERSSLHTGRLQSAIADKASASRIASLTRHDFAVFDPISTAPESALSTGPGLQQSAFDSPLSVITTDLAPYVRSIVQYDLALEEQRERLNSLLADGDGRRAKRARTTRAARSAQEGSQRASTRRARWFTKQLDLEAVLATGGREWPRVMLGVQMQAESAEGGDGVASGAESI